MTEEMLRRELVKEVARLLHDLNGQVTAIVGYAEIENSELNESDRIAAMHKAGTRSAAILRRLVVIVNLMEGG